LKLLDEISGTALMLKTLIKLGLIRGFTHGKIIHIRDQECKWSRVHGRYYIYDLEKYVINSLHK
jgi:hypothetical protein